MARAMGIAVELSTRPKARVALVEGTVTSPTVVEAFTITTSKATVAEQAHDIATGIRNRLHGLAPDAVLVRRADFPPRPSNQEGPRVRLIVEGACVAHAMDVVPATLLLTGRDAAARTGMSKDTLDAAAEAVSGGDYAKAVAAAMAVL
jgi:hypothetical protein